MKFADIILMVKSGFTYEQIKDLINTPEPAQSQPEPEPEPKEPDIEKSEPAAVEPVEPTEPDYKSLYLQAQSDLESTRKALKDAQKVNRTQDNSGSDVTEEETLEKLFIDML